MTVHQRLSMQYENVIFPDKLGFQCKNCGVCCRDAPTDANFKEQKIIEAKGFANFMDDPNNPGNRNIRRKKDGGCFFLTEENACKIHGIKPKICVLEPFIITDFDPETNRIFLDLNPLATKNCKGLFKGDMIIPEEIGKAAQSIMKEFLNIIAKKTKLPVTDNKVASLARELLLDFNSVGKKQVE
jgi:Fe-S-cluster containining protein